MATLHAKHILLIKRENHCFNRTWFVSIESKRKIVAEIEQQWIENIGAERMQMLKEDLTTFVTKENTGKLSSNIRPVW